MVHEHKHPCRFRNAEQMSVEVKFFGLLADIAGKNSIQLENIPDMDSLKEKIFSMHPEMKRHKFLIASNKSIIKGNIPVNDGDEIAFLPPFAGG
jgi:molybdopterin synthase sulfur carrier subunit